MGAQQLDTSSIGGNLTAFVLESDQSIRLFLEVFLADLGFAVAKTTNLASALERLAGRAVDVVFIGEQPGDDGLELLRALRERGDKAEVVFMAAANDVATVTGAVALGISALVPLPLPKPDELRQVVSMVADKRRRRILDERAVSDLISKNEALEEMSVRDPLTRLYNHAHLQQVLESEIMRCSRASLPVSLLFIDLDDFKAVNDSSGHVAGDTLLETIASIIMGTNPKSNRFHLRAQDVAARYAGDEFAIVLPDTDKAGAAVLAERLRSAINDHAFEVVDGQTISVGIATHPEDANSRVALVEAADTALYEAKRLGKNRIVSFDDEMRSVDGRRGRVSQETELRHIALARSIVELAFDYVYQPIVYANSGMPHAFEALVRPRHKEIFPHPGVLIDVAEKSGQISPLGRALRQSSVLALNEMNSDTLLFVNIHPQELFDPEFADVEPFMAMWTGRIVFELTEVARFRNYDRVRQIIRSLQGFGFQIALDDLGAGYSGLNSLAMLEPDYVKLDMELVHRVAVDKRARRLAKHLVEFASDEGMRVIAEGIETEEQQEVCLELGCELLQGWLFSKGVPMGQIASWTPPKLKG